MKNKIEERVTFKLSDKQLCAIMIAIGVIIYFFYSFFLTALINNEVIDDIIKTLLTTFISIFTLSLLLEISSLKKLIIGSLEEAFKQFKSILINKDFSIYTNMELINIEERIISERYKDLNTTYRERAIESILWVKSNLENKVKKCSYRDQMHIDIQYQIMSDGNIEYTFTETYKLFHHTRKLKFEEERWLTFPEHRDTFCLKQLIINKVDYTEKVNKIIEHDREQRHSSTGLSYSFNSESSDCCFDIVHIYSYIKKYASPFCYRFKDFNINTTVQLKLTDASNLWKPFLYALTQTNNTEEIVSKDGHSIHLSINGWDIPGSGICFGVYKL